VSSPSPLYDDPVLAEAYARVTATNVYNAAYERPAVRALLGAVRGLDVLDAGCAAGEHAVWLQADGARLVALDASETMVRITRSRLGDGAHVLQADLAQPLPFADASFDVVLSSLTLHYLDDWGLPLREFARVLRPGGRLVITTHHPFLLPMLRMIDDYDYHTVALVEDAFDSFAAEPVPVRYYHRPLARIVADVLGAGFVIRGLHEPMPTAEADARNPAAAERLRKRPWFLIVDAERDCR